MMDPAPLAQIGPNPEMTVALMAIIGLTLVAVWALARWCFSGPQTSDPWDQKVATELEQENATPLCHRCLVPHPDSADFCQQCGAPVGQYTNWLPFPQLFSIGHTLRIGSTGQFRRSRLIIFGFFLFGLAEYMFFAPVYWFVFLRNLSRAPQQAVNDEVPPPLTNGPDPL